MSEALIVTTFILVAFVGFLVIEARDEILGEIKKSRPRAQEPPR